MKATPAAGADTKYTPGKLPEYLGLQLAMIVKHPDDRVVRSKTESDARVVGDILSIQTELTLTQVPSQAIPTRRMQQYAYQIRRQSL